MASATQVRAQAPTGNEFVVNAQTTEGQLHPSVALESDGSFLIFWESFNPHGSYSDVFGRRFDTSGTPVGGDFQVNTFTTLSQDRPTVAPGADGSFIVTWESEWQDGDRFSIVGRRYDASGATIGSEFQVNTYTTDRQGGPAIASGTDGQFVVVWSSFEQDGWYWGIFGQRFDAQANRLGSEFQISQFTPDYQYRPSVAVAPDGGFVVVWHSYYQDGSTYGVFARRYDAGGVPQGDEFQVNTYTTDYQKHPKVAFAPDGTFVVVWDSWGQDGDVYGVFARRFSATGLPLGTEHQVNTYTTISQALPAVAFSADGHYIVTWQSWKQDGPEWGVFGRFFSSSDEPISDEFQINQFTSFSQTDPSVTALADGQFVVAWESYRQDGSRFGIVARRYVTPDVIFRDGFETGDVAGWSAASSDGGDLSAAADAAQKSSAFGLKAIVNDTNSLYVQDNRLSREDRYRARFYLDPSDFDPGEAASHFRTRVFLGLKGDPTQRLLAIVLKRKGGQYSLMGRARRDDGSHWDTGFYPISSGSHVVELRWSRATAPGANDGAFALWLDGALEASTTTLDNDLSPLDLVRLGALSVKDGASGTLRFDEFESHRMTYVGP